jgi:predicted DNA-binding helix-hairpin-helix protein
VSCSSSGSNRKNKKDGLGNASMAGICHSWSDDGRCISLLKILMTNYCIYDCVYCVNRSSNDLPRAIFTPEEKSPPLVRENRIYQADWLLSSYNFKANELLDEHKPNFDLELDPKCDWPIKI